MRKRRGSGRKRGEESLEEWQAVYQIGMRGQFLAHEPYSDWAKWRRSRVADMLWQSVHAQWQRAKCLGNEAQSIEAARQLLFDFWQMHQTNEDAFCLLIELLRKQGRLQQAEEYYAQLCEVLDHEGCLPQKRTQEAMNILRTTRFPQANGQGTFHTAEGHTRIMEGTVDHTDEETRGAASMAQGQELAGQRIIHETRHLIGRGTWLARVQQMVQRFPAKKLIILQGPVGVGKSSELMRLASAFQHTPKDCQLPGHLAPIKSRGSDWRTGSSSGCLAGNTLE